MACANTFKVNLDLIKWLLDPSYKREICGYACRGGMFELGLLAEHYGLVERDNVPALPVLERIIRVQEQLVLLAAVRAHHHGQVCQK